ncbi:hypothetical protein KC351_g333 [Hortaea werneckii]|nr:hypothetical protein KC351_g333 [Hortaea werneckii]
MAVPANCRSSLPSPSSNAQCSGKEGQSNTSNRPPASQSPQISQSDGHTESIVGGDWMAVFPSSTAGSEAPGDLSASFSEAHETTSRAGSANRGMDNSGDRGKHEGYKSREDDMRADGEENVIGKLAARLAEREGSVQGDREAQELVDRELRAYGVDLGMEREGDGEDDAEKTVMESGQQRFDWG